MEESVQVQKIPILSQIFGRKKPEIEEYSLINDLLEAIEEGIVIAGKEGKIIKVNPQVEEMFGLKGVEFLGKPLTEIAALIDKAKHQGSLGAPRISVKKVFRGKEAIATIVVIPTVDKKHEIEEMETEFLSVAAHQLRTPLGSVRWAMEMILGGDMGPIPEKIKSIMERIYSSNQWMISLVNDLLSASRIDQKRVPNEPILIDYVDIVKTVITELQPNAIKRSVSVKLNFDQPSTSKIMLDPKRFREVIENILGNAIKYSKESGQVLIKLEQTPQAVKISVKDSGMGIPKDEQSKIFAKFYRAKNALQDKIEGTGLGLFVVKSYIDGWGGKIWFDSQPGLGTTFYLEIPTKYRIESRNENPAENTIRLSGFQ